MTRPVCHSPTPLSDLVAYHRRELAPEAEAPVEEHFFACERCARELETLERLRAGIAALVRSGRVTATATAALVARAEAEGVRVRTYRVAPGQQVACTAAPEDELVVVRLAGDFAGAAPVDVLVEGTHLATGLRESLRMEDVAVDHAAGEIVLVLPGERVRSLPRTRWRCDVRAGRGGAERLLATYRLDHTPWEERAERE